MARGSVIFPAPELDPEQYYTKAEVDAKIDYLAALNTNATRLVYTATAPISAKSGWSTTLPDTVDYVEFAGTKIARGGSVKESRTVFYNDDTPITGYTTLTFATDGTLSASRFSLSGGSSYLQDQFGTANWKVQGYHYITLKDFEG